MTGRVRHWRPAATAGVGDLATHVSGTLDAREVTATDTTADGETLVWLRGPSSASIGPFPAQNYTYQRRADTDARTDPT